MKRGVRIIGLSAWTIALSGVGLLGGCDSAPKKRSARPVPVTRVAKAEGATDAAPKRVEKPTAMTNSDKAALRERALGILSNTALGGSPEERANAIEALTIAPGRLSMVMDNALVDQNLGVRAVALLAGGKTKLNAFVPTYRVLLRDPSPFVRSAAIFALRRSGQNADPTPLSSMLIDPSPKVRAQAAFILGELGDRSALPLLRESAGASMSRANQAQIRVMDLQIAEARVKLGEEAAYADIRAALFPSRVEDLEATVFAIQIAGQLKDNTSVNRLIQLIESKDEEKQVMPPEVRIAAATALARMGQPNGTYIAREYFAGESPALRSQAANLFGEIRRVENLPVLDRMMADPDGRVRVAAAAAIVRITDAESRN